MDGQPAIQIDAVARFDATTVFGYQREFVWSENGQVWRLVFFGISDKDPYNTELTSFTAKLLPTFQLTN